MNRAEIITVTTATSTTLLLGVFLDLYQVAVKLVKLRNRLGKWNKWFNNGKSELSCALLVKGSWVLKRNSQMRK
jgi:hypothetical protein